MMACTGALTEVCVAHTGVQGAMLALLFLRCIRWEDVQSVEEPGPSHVEARTETAQSLDPQRVFPVMEDSEKMHVLKQGRVLRMGCGAMAVLAVSSWVLAVMAFVLHAALALGCN